MESSLTSLLRACFAGRAFFLFKLIGVLILSAAWPQLSIGEDRTAPLSAKEGQPSQKDIKSSVGRIIKKGQIYELEGDSLRAFKEYKKAIKIAGKDYRGYFRMANLQQKIGDFDSAELNFEKAMELSPQNPLIHNNLAWLYIETNRAGFAESLILEILSKDMDRNYIYHDTLATAYYHMFNYILAKQYYNEAILYVPAQDIRSQLSIYSHIRDMYLRINNAEMVFKIEKILEKLELGHPATMMDLGVGGLQ